MSLPPRTGLADGGDVDLVSSPGEAQAEPTRLLALLMRNLVGLADMDDAFLVGMVNGQRYDIKSWYAWDWTQGVGLYALARIHERTGDPDIVAQLRDWFAQMVVKPAPAKTINTMAPLYALAYLAEISGDHRHDSMLAEWGEWAMRDLPRTAQGGFQHIVVDHVHDGQLWDDTLMMTVLPLARIGLLLDRPHYVDEAVRQFLLHIAFLHDRATGLWFHGWSFVRGDHLSGARWARGNSWVTMAIPDFFELLGDRLDPGVAMFLRATLIAQVDALAAVQREDGLWPTILDDPESYGETSATAGFGYGILKGVRLGLLDPRYRAIGERAVAAVVEQIDRDTGAVGNVSFGTPIFATVEEYKRVPITPMPYGQAMAMLAIDEAARQGA